MSMTKDSPEYKALSQNRTDLESRLEHCLREVSQKLRDSGTLTLKQYKTVTDCDGPKGCEKLLDIILQSVEIKQHKEEAFSEFTEVMKMCGNRFFKSYIMETIEADRNKLAESSSEARSEASSEARSEALVPPGQTAQLTDDTDGAGCSANDQFRIDQEKMKVSDAELDKEIQQVDYPHLAGCVDDVSLYPDALNLAGHEKTDVRAKSALHGTRVGMSEYLGKWKSHKTYNATFRALVTVMYGLNNAEDALKVMKYIIRKR